MRVAGKLQQAAFGNTAKGIGAWFDGVLDRFRNRVVKAKPEDVTSKGTTAVERGSEKAFELIAGVQGDKMYKAVNDQIRLQKEEVNLQKEIRDAIRKRQRAQLAKASL